MVYTENRDQVLLAAVSVSDAQITGNGQAESLLEHGSNDCAAHPALVGCEKMSTNLAWDRFKKLRTDVKQKDATKPAASGIAENYTKTDERVQDSCNPMDE